jgi:hypothetical protein
MDQLEAKVTLTVTKPMYQAVKNALEIIKKDLLGWLNMTGAQ